ncbi:MAG: O-acetyl-ADP-ribose deacetylase [Gammaproteobacteria bacterium]|nr:O-acetyl-ADP-ribose deacetylase [Gammaproteobacteria bacterium]MBQ0838875.1 O-acetyl-ADP-ribose deacetylase [Gammaproteobacteria bacterium]
MNKMEVLETDITQLKVDAIVNAAKNSLLGGGGVDGAIHAAAGPGLLAACKKLNGCATGEAKITPAYQLPAKFVIHTVGPVWRGGQHNEAQLLAACYRHSLQLALENGLRSIAFAAISCGVYGYPIAEACQIAVNEVRSFLASHEAIEEVIFVSFNRPVTQALLECLGKPE